MLLRIAVLCLLPVALLAQDASLTLAGTVVSSSGEPLPRALVSIMGFLSPAPTAPGHAPPRVISKTVLTDPVGAFRFSALPAARYTVTAEKPGFQAVITPGSRPGSAIDLKSSVENVRVVLSPLGAITGTVVDQYGQPMRGVDVVTLTSTVQNGLRKTIAGQTVRTDDRGAYRVWDVASGKYYVKATGQDGATLLPGSPNTLRNDIGDSFSPVYSGGGFTMDSAIPVEIGGTSHAVADFRLKLEPAWRINGILHNFTPGGTVTYSIMMNGEDVVWAPDRFDASTGAFQFKDTVAGSYILRARQGDKAGEVAVKVEGEDTAPLLLTLHPSVDIPVNVRFTNSPPAPSEPMAVQGSGDIADPMNASGGTCLVSLAIDPAEDPYPYYEITSAGHSGLHKVVVGDYRPSFNCFGSYIRSALAGTQDLLADPVLRVAPDSIPQPIEILATYGGGTLTGRMEGDSTFSVQYLLVPQFSGSAGPLTEPGLVGLGNGTEFVFSNLAPGSYTLYAFAHSDIEYRNPAFLKSLAGGQSIQIEDNKKQDIVVHEVIQ